MTSSIEVLQKFESFIPPFVRQYYLDIKANGRGYRRYRRDVDDLGKAPWDRQLTIPNSTEKNMDDRL